jgi:hypothetical protein
MGKSQIRTFWKREVSLKQKLFGCKFFITQTHTTFRHKASGRIVSGGRVPFTAVLCVSVKFAFSLPHVATQEPAKLAVIACVCWPVVPDSQVSGFCFNTVNRWKLKGEASQAFT